MIVRKHFPYIAIVLIATGCNSQISDDVREAKLLLEDFDAMFNRSCVYEYFSIQSGITNMYQSVHVAQDGLHHASWDQRIVDNGIKEDVDIIFVDGVDSSIDIVRDRIKRSKLAFSRYVASNPHYQFVISLRRSLDPQEFDELIEQRQTIEHVKPCHCRCLGNWLAGINTANSPIAAAIGSVFKVNYCGNSLNESFPNSREIRLSPIDNDRFNVSIFVDAETRLVIGSQSSFSHSAERAGRIMIDYDLCNGTYQPAKQKFYQDDGTGIFRLSRIQVFTLFQPTSSFDHRYCYLKTFGFPEPDIPTAPLSLPSGQRWLFAIALAVLAVAIALLHFKSRAENS